jgi:glycosyltransferase involved in cell wall biosynthesis
LIRADHLQNLYLATMRFRLPIPVSTEMAYWSKRWLDRKSERPARASDVFLFYSGAGLRTATRLRGQGVARVVEAVNSHVLVQESILREEHQRLGLEFQSFHRREVARRVEEYDTADAILCPSDFVRDTFLEKGLPPERVFVVPYGMTLPPHAPPVPRSEGVFRVLYVGQISVRKGLRYLFEAFRQLRHPRKELSIVGSMTKESGLHDVTPPEGTRFRGVLKGEALAEAYRSSTVFVLPTVEDGLGLVLGEALSFGLPVVTTAHSGGANLFDNGSEGFIVPIRSAPAIAEKLQQLADDPALLHRMSAAARARAQALGGWDTAGHALVEALTRISKLPPR